MIASASADRTARLWDVTTASELFTLVGHKGSVNKVWLHLSLSLARSLARLRTRTRARAHTHHAM
jgi:WD40 repeat protein